MPSGSNLLGYFPKGTDAPDRYCVEIPIAGQRPFEGGDISLFKSLMETDNKGE
jgi:hypothetical protein